MATVIDASGIRTQDLRVDGLSHTLPLTTGPIVVVPAISFVYAQCVMALVCTHCAFATLVEGLEVLSLLITTNCHN